MKTLIILIALSACGKSPQGPVFINGVAPTPSPTITQSTVCGIPVTVDEISNKLIDLNTNDVISQGTHLVNIPLSSTQNDTPTCNFAVNGSNYCTHGWGCPVTN
jgi:hypothetical protein